MRELRISQLRSNLNILHENIISYNGSYTDCKTLKGEVIYSIGSSKLYKYGSGHPILFIPSHINKSYILDFNSQFSLMQKLAKLGFMPLLLDWGDVSAERELDFAGYLNQRLLPVVEYINHIYEKPVIAGYCMGGLFTLCIAQLWPHLVKAMIHISTPWNFHGIHKSKPVVVEQIIEQLGKMPTIKSNMLQLSFYSMHNQKVNDKFLNIKQMDDRFIEVENWVNDGLDMSTPLYIDIFKNFMVDNLPFKGIWHVNNKLINPSLNKHKSLFIVAKKDTIAPNICTLPLAISLKYNIIKMIDCGHIGMMIDEKYELDKIISDWVKS